MPVGSVQAAVIAIVTSVVSLIAAFAIIDNETAAIVVGAAGTIIPAIFLIANSIIHHGETPVGTPPTKTV